MNFTKLALAAMALVATPALAQSQVSTGATVYGPQGNAVGTIVSVDGGQAVIDTGTHKIALALESYGQGENGPTITVTKDQLNGMAQEATAQAKAARDAALVAGAEVMAADHGPLGRIISVDGDNIVIARGGDEAKKVTLLREYFTASDHGLMARLTNAEIDAAMAGTPATQAETAAPAETDEEPQN